MIQIPSCPVFCVFLNIFISLKAKFWHTVAAAFYSLSAKTSEKCFDHMSVLWAQIPWQLLISEPQAEAEVWHFISKSINLTRETQHRWAKLVEVSLSLFYLYGLITPARNQITAFLITVAYVFVNLLDN